MGVDFVPANVPFSPGGLNVSSISGRKRCQSWVGWGKGNKEDDCYRLKKYLGPSGPTVRNWVCSSCFANGSQSSLEWSHPPHVSQLSLLWQEAFTLSAQNGIRDLWGRVSLHAGHIHTVFQICWLILCNPHLTPSWLLPMYPQLCWSLRSQKLWLQAATPSKASSGI